MRERRRVSYKKSTTKRITPAHAGKTCCGGISIPQSEDHPRACGKDSISFFKVGIAVGSPPRMRERLPRNHWACPGRGITPAHAGKTFHKRKSRPGRKDHPRTCGKDVFFTSVADGVGGSPPRMRERPGGCFSHTLKDRITPAHAGKTSLGFFAFLHTRDHPRACGKDF